MQRLRPTDTSSLAAARTRPILVAVLLFGLSMVFAPTISAQDSTPEDGTPAVASPTTVATPAATPAATPQAAPADTLGTVLMSYDFEEMPPTPLNVRLLRITLAPGASVPMHTHPGPEFNLVESGTLSASIDGTAIVGTEGESSEVTEAQQLAAGEWIMYPAETGMNLANEGEEDVVLLAAVVLPVASDTPTITYADGEPAPEDLEGVSFVVLGDGLIQQFPAGPATVTVDQLTVAAGEPVPGYSGPALLSKSSGTFAIRADAGDVQVTRTATPQLESNAISGQEFTLADSDAAFFPAGYDAIERPDGPDDVVFTRLLLQPEGELANGLASVSVIDATTTQVLETLDDLTGDDDFGVGAIVAISEDGVRVRTDSSTESEIVESYPAGTQFELVGGPVEGEDFTWYQVVGVGDLSTVEGWLVTEFMDVIEPAPEGAEQEGEDGSSGSEQADVATEAEPEPDLDEILGALEDPEGTPAPAGDIQVGTTVATNDENLRIRTEGNAGGDIITAVALGTQLEVIGGPEEADGFTWFEVQVVDDPDTTGWVASDFLEVVAE